MFCSLFEFKFHFREEDGTASPDLLMANVSVVPWKNCNGALSYNGGVGKHAFCAGSRNGGVDSCQVSNKLILSSK